MKYLVLVVLLVLLSGCGYEKPLIKEDFKTVCLDGIEYYFLNKLVGSVTYSYMAPKYKPDGSLSTCKQF